MLCDWAHLPYTGEDFNKFAHLLPKEGLSSIERGRKKQGLVPDFMLEITSERRDKKKEQAELNSLVAAPPVTICPLLRLKTENIYYEGCAEESPRADGTTWARR